MLHIISRLSPAVLPLEDTTYLHPLPVGFRCHTWDLGGAQASRVTNIFREQVNLIPKYLLTLDNV